MKYRAVTIVVLAAGGFFGGGTLLAWLDSKGPIIKCDVTALKVRMPIAEVRALCGEPRSERVDEEPWYPLASSGGRPQRSYRTMLIYGSSFSMQRNVNLYFADGFLRSVQVYGDGK